MTVWFDERHGNRFARFECMNAKIDLSGLLFERVGRDGKGAFLLNSF